MTYLIKDFITPLDILTNAYNIDNQLIITKLQNISKKQSLIFLDKLSVSYNPLFMLYTLYKPEK